MGSGFKRGSQKKEADGFRGQLAGEIGSVMEAIRKNPLRKEEILVHYVLSFYEAVKEALSKYGSVTPHYVILADTQDFFGFLVTEEVLRKARDIKAEAIVSVEGFQAKDDIGDVIYHVSMSAPCMGVLGWVFKVRLADKKMDIVHEIPYLFYSHEKVKTLGELVAEMEAGPEK